MMFVVLMLAQVSTAAAAPAIPAGVRLEATSTSSFTVDQPRLDVHGRAIHVEGVVCRRPLHLGLSPPRVTIERVAADGTVAAPVYAALPPLPRRLDQRCVRFGVPLDPAPVTGEQIRICLARSGGCAAQ